MAFVLKSSDSYTWPVVFRQPGNGGKRVKSDFIAEFARLSQTRIAEIQQQAQRRADGDESLSISDTSVADEVLVGWEGVQDADGEEIAFSPAMKSQLLEVPMLASAIVEAYFFSLIDEKRKN
jgi:hypothetical protein|tara:strand:- start:181 stop:546 length:366 start_codon:yes stop_codon:yes gene_type:complete